MEGRFFKRGLLVVPSVLDRAIEEPGFFATVMAEPEVPMHDPQLEPRDEAVFLLTAAAEIEHALMVQYLYAAYSVRVLDNDPNFTQLRAIQGLLLQIAREEMGHLITVQNLLHLIGGPLNFGREHSPYASEIYPFRFKLEPLTLDSLAKYVTAESPVQLPSTLPADDLALLKQISQDAVRANDGRKVQHVGPIFKRLEQLFQGGDGGLQDEDIRLDTFELQAKFEDWGFEARSAEAGEPLIVDSFEGVDVNVVRAAAVAAVKKISEQGEGFDQPSGPGQSESHFERFFDIYKRFSDLANTGVLITWPVAENANTTSAPVEAPDAMHMVEMIQEAHAGKGRITHPRARAWAQLFNLRYRMLLGHLSHFMRLNQELYGASPDSRQGDRTARGLLLIWTFNEMRRLKKIATKLVQLPKDDPPGQIHAGPPFELPYSLNLPDREKDRWRMHLDVSRASVRLVVGKLQDEQDEFLEDLMKMDIEVQATLRSLAAGGSVPQESLPTEFQKAVLILEEAVRGFSIGVHGNFWGNKTRDQFLDNPSPQPIGKNPDGTFNFDPNVSPLVQRLEGTASGNRMPRFRPPVPDERIGFIRQWIAGQCPDNDPPGQPGIMRERNPKQEPLDPPDPPPTGPLSFAADIKNLFRETPDRSSMLSFFDLHRYEDVRDNATRILQRIEDGSMPCDGSWPPERTATFRKWIQDGKLP